MLLVLSVTGEPGCPILALHVGPALLDGDTNATGEIKDAAFALLDPLQQAMGYKRGFENTIS